MTTVTMGIDKATYLVQSLAVWGQADGARLTDVTPADPEVAAVELSAEALKTLSRLGEEVDGHFDGINIWIGGTDYPVAK